MAVRGNNPGNLRYNEVDKWQGLAEPPQDHGFCAFTSPAFGIRALARVLIAYQDKHGCRTIRDIIDRYAPPADNNPTETYIANVCKWTDLTPREVLDLHSYEHARPLVEAIIHQEQGYEPYSGMQIDEGLRRAGIVKKVAPTAAESASKDRNVIAGSIVGAATAAQQVIGSVSGVWDSINRLGIDPRYLMGAFGLCAAVVGVWFVIEWVQRRRQGLA